MEAGPLMSARGDVPPPPLPNATVFTSEECAGFLRIPMSRWRTLRQTDPTLPKARVLSKGNLRWSRREIEEWFLSRPVGWSTSGGPRRGMRGALKPAAEAVAAKEGSLE